MNTATSKLDVYRERYRHYLEHPETALKPDVSAFGLVTHGEQWAAAKVRDDEHRILALRNSIALRKAQNDVDKPQ